MEDRHVEDTATMQGALDSNNNDKPAAAAASTGGSAQQQQQQVCPFLESHNNP